jgi:hypothetical protein
MPSPPAAYLDVAPAICPEILACRSLPLASRRARPSRAEMNTPDRVHAIPAVSDTLTLCPPVGRPHGVRRVGLLPRHVPRRPVDRRDLPPGQPQPDLDLGPVVAGVEDPPPEGPDPLPLQAAEEGPLLQPPLGRRLGKLGQRPLRQPNVLVQVGWDRWSISWRQQLFDQRLHGADELGEEAALREGQVDQDRPEGVRLLVRLKSTLPSPPPSRSLGRIRGFQTCSR